MKVFVLAPKEDWIVDRMTEQFVRDNQSICTSNIDEADVIFDLADWCFDKIPEKVLRKKVPILMMCHHFVPEKFKRSDAAAFKARDEFVTRYVVPNFRTQDFVSKRSTKPIEVVPYWLHTPSWRKEGSKEVLRRKHGIPKDAFVVGSFQRDTEGSDLKSPKLEKAPDLLADYIDRLHSDGKNPFVVLGGWRRQYILDRLIRAGIPHKYVELPNQTTISELYQTLDLYPVSSRYEGGPQAFLEAGALGVPVISRPVGMAEQVLPESAINDDLSLARAAVPRIDAMRTPAGYSRFIEILSELMK